MRLSDDISCGDWRRRCDVTPCDVTGCDVTRCGWSRVWSLAVSKRWRLRRWLSATTDLQVRCTSQRQFFLPVSSSFSCHVVIVARGLPPDGSLLTYAFVALPAIMSKEDVIYETGSTCCYCYYARFTASFQGQPG